MYLGTLPKIYWVYAFDLNVNAFDLNVYAFVLFQPGIKYIHLNLSK